MATIRAGSQQSRDFQKQHSVTSSASIRQTWYSQSSAVTGVYTSVPGWCHYHFNGSFLKRNLTTNIMGNSSEITTISNDIWTLGPVFWSPGSFGKGSKYLLRAQVLRWVNSSLPSAAYMRQWIGSALVQIKPSSKLMLDYCHFDHWEQTSVWFQSEYKTFHSRKCIWKHHLRKGYHLVQVEMS